MTKEEEEALYWGAISSIEKALAILKELDMAKKMRFRVDIRRS